MLDLRYTLIQNPSAQIWFECLKSASEKSSINSTRFYNFKNRPEQTLENLVQKLETRSADFPHFCPSSTAQNSIKNQTKPFRTASTIFTQILPTAT